MKKHHHFTILFTLIAVMSLTACQNTPTEEKAVEVKVASIETEPIKPIDEIIINVEKEEPTPQESQEPTSKEIKWTNKEIQQCIEKLEGQSIAPTEAASIDSDRLEIHLYNDFNTEDLRYLTGITGLYLYAEKLEDISFIENMTQLKDLYIESESLTDLSPLTNNTTIENLELNVNEVESISELSGMTSLKSLYIRGNKLADISTLSELVSLEECGFKSNSLETITADFSNLTNLTYVKIISDKLTDTTALSTLPKISGVEQEVIIQTGNVEK